MRPDPSQPPVPSNPSGDRKGRAPRIALLLLALAAGLWLLWATAALCLNISPDYAIVVTMARDIAHGRGFPVFFYGQAYMGSLEPAFSALLCRLFGDGPFVASLGATIPGFAAVLALALLAKRLSGRLAAALALLLAVPGPYVWTHYLVSPRGGYALVSLLCVAGLWIASVTPVFAAPGSRRIRSRAFAAFGLVCGLAFWNDWLALPVLFGAALVLLGRTGLRVFSWRAWLPGAAAFAAGSLPWWVWNARHGWASLCFESGGHRPNAEKAIRNAFGDRIAAFAGDFGGAWSFWASSLPWLLLALFALAVAGLLLSGRRRARALAPAAAAVGIGTAAFWAGYAFSSFGTTESPRYFVPLVPGAVLITATGLAEFVRAAAERRSRPIAAAAVAVAGAAAYAGLELRLALPLLRSIRQGSEVRQADFRRWPDVPGLDRPAFADYIHFPANWATDERVCLVTPQGGRHQRYLDALEREPFPSVAGNHASFSAFLDATGGSSSLSRTGGDVPVHHGIRPPPRADVLPRGAVARIATPDGIDGTGALLDGNVATFLRDTADPEGAVAYDIELREPTEVWGLVATCRRDGKAHGWSAEEIGPDGALSPLSREERRRGWFWSGERFYLGGTDDRWVLRWKPRTLRRIRVTFLGLRPGGLPLVNELRLLGPARTPPLDAAAVAEAVRGVRAGPGPVRLFADRWLAGILGGMPRDPTLDMDAIGSANYVRAYDARTRLDPREKSLVVVPEALAGETEAAFAEAGLSPSKTVTGGAAIYLADEKPGPAAEAFERTGGCLRFVGGRLAVDRPLAPPVEPGREAPASFLDGRIELVGCPVFPPVLKRGETARIGFLFRSPRRDVRPDGGWVIVGFRKDGRTVFPTGAPLPRPDRSIGAPDLLGYDSLLFPFRVPKDAPPGEYAVEVGLRRHLDSRRFLPVRPGPGLAVRERAVELPWTVRIE